MFIIVIFVDQNSIYVKYIAFLNNNICFYQNNVLYTEKVLAKFSLDVAPIDVLIQTVSKIRFVNLKNLVLSL